MKNKKNKNSEATLEKRLVTKITNLGGIAWKFTSPGTIGVPDRIIMFQGKLCFVEMKAPGKQMREIQKWRKEQIEREGFPVMCLNSEEQVDEFINCIIRESVKESDQK